MNIKKYSFIKQLLFLGLLFSFVTSVAQVKIESGTKFTNLGSTVSVMQNLTNDGEFINHNDFILKGDLLNNGTSGYFGTGNFKFKGTTTQTVSGLSPFFQQNFTFDNTAGIVVSKMLSVNNTLAFTNGLLTASTQTEPLQFEAGATYSGSTDPNHVNGWVRSLATSGSFVYPVGNDSKLQSTTVNFTANATGVDVKYNASDAGTANFLGGGHTASETFNLSE